MSRRPLITTLIGSLCIFVIARLTVAGSLVNEIDANLWQLTEPTWIASKSFWSTVMSFHAQPPGMIMLQWMAANHTPDVIGMSMLLAAAVFVCCCGGIAASVTNSQVAGLLTALVIAFQPSTLLYSHWFFSSVYLAAFVSLNLLCVFIWARTGNASWLAWAAFVLAFASLFHAAYFAAFLIIAGWMFLFPRIRRIESRRPEFVIPLAIAGCIALFTPVKNYAVFGFFSTSSWAPLNIANVYTNNRFIWQKCQSRVLRSERLQDDYGASKAAAYRDVLNRNMLFRPAKPGGEVNLNHLDVMRCTDDVRFLDQLDPATAALNIVRSLSETIALPAWDYEWLGRQNLEKIAHLVRLYEFFVTRADQVEYKYYVDIDKRPDNWLESLPSLTSVLLAIAMIFAGVVLLADFAQYWRRNDRDIAREPTRRQLSRVYPCILALLVLAIFVFASGQELNRVKFSLTPLFIAVFLEALRRCANARAPGWLRWLPGLRPAGKTQ